MMTAAERAIERAIEASGRVVGKTGDDFPVHGNRFGFEGWLWTDSPVDTQRPWMLKKPERWELQSIQTEFVCLQAIKSYADIPNALRSIRDDITRRLNEAAEFVERKLGEEINGDQRSRRKRTRRCAV